MWQIEDLKSTLSKRDGLARPNQFRVSFGIPAVVRSRVDADTRDLDILCESATIPGRSISTQEYSRGRQMVRNPYTFINTDVSFAFKLTNDYFVKNLFDTWINSIINTQTYTALYKDEYAANVTIEQINAYGKSVHKVTLIKAYPITMNEIALSNAEQSSTSLVEVTLTYDNYEVK